MWRVSAEGECGGRVWRASVEGECSVGGEGGRVRRASAEGVRVCGGNEARRTRLGSSSGGRHNYDQASQAAMRTKYVQ